MKTRCPACGATASLDTLVSHESAREALMLAFGLSGSFGRLVIKYLSLFRSDSRDLSMDRVAKLLNELVPDVQAQRIERNRMVHEAPIEAWVWAIEQVLAARDSGKLKPPLKSHGFLYETITFWKPNNSGVVTQTGQSNVTRQQSKGLSALAALEQMKHE